MPFAVRCCRPTAEFKYSCAASAFRVRVNHENVKKGIKLTMLAFLIKASVAALQKYPDFNASLDGEEVVYKQYFHIGFAADTPSGLLVPVIRDADKKGLLQIAREVAELAQIGREGRLKRDHMQGGSFSISSLGGIGGTGFTPIINAPEVAILGAARADHKPKWEGTRFEPRLLLPLYLSWDHRVVDGAAAARFLVYLSVLLADFRRALL
jgi:pyruvate dehydrogenase E2 component (dihydrolipoamide acetyltransferase)